MDEHPNLARIRQALATYNSEDPQAMRAFLAPDIEWHVGGDHPLTGDYQGVDDVIRYFGRVKDLTDSTLRIEPEELFADDRHAAIVMRVTAQGAEQKLDVLIAEVLTLDRMGRWQEYWALADDQASVDAFWSRQSSRN